MKCLIDGDILVYKIGFAVDNVYYMVGKRKFKKKASANAYAAKKGIDKSEIIRYHIRGREEDAEKEIDFFIRGIKKETEANELQVFISGSTNFRTDIAVTAPYKGNRDVTHKPHLASYIKEYLQNEWGAKMVEGIEADDALGMEQNDNTIICSIDKDLLMVEGWHYNFDTKRTCFISPEQGRFNFYTQLLTGDVTDNIKGIRGIGKVGAANMLEGMDVLDMFSTVGVAYAKHFEQPEERLEENGKLLYILRQPDEEWSIEHEIKFIRSMK